jgi:hypothetical protein
MRLHLLVPNEVRSPQRQKRKVAHVRRPASSHADAAEPKSAAVTEYGGGSHVIRKEAIARRE